MIPEHFSIEGLLTLSEILTSYADSRTNFVQRIYERRCRHFTENVDGAVLLGLISQDDGNLHLSNAMVSTFRKCSVSEDIRAQLSYCVIRAALTSSHRVREHLVKFSRHFELSNDRFSWRPRIADIPKYAGLRNVFLEAGVIDFDSSQECLTMTIEFRKQMDQIDHTSRVSPEQLQAIARSNSEVGNRAELAVLSHELILLKEFPQLVSKVRHVALDDVSAGFDILSFELPVAGNSTGREKRIEVKAVSPIDWRFHWSRKEMAVAAESGRTYFLYLVPILHGGLPSVSDIQIIQNPHQALLETDGPWKGICDSFEFFPTELPFL